MSQQIDPRTSTSGAGALLYALHEGWNERRYDDVADLLAPRCNLALIGGDLFAGAGAVARALETLAEALPAATIEIVSLRGDAGWAVAESVLRGRHEAAVALADGRIVPPTGRLLERRLCEIAQIRAGRLRELHVYAGAVEGLAPDPARLGADPRVEARGSGRQRRPPGARP